MQKNNNDSSVNIIKTKILNYEKTIDSSEVGYILSVSDGIAYVSGIGECFLSEQVIVNEKYRAIVLNLEEDFTVIAFLDDYLQVKENDCVKRTHKLMSVPVGDSLLGRVIDATGKPIDNSKPIDSKKFRPIERVAPGVMSRKSVTETLETGILMIDSLIPIGKGQRELIIGDRQTGKTSIGIDAIVNQKGKNVYCIYVAIGQKQSTVVKILEKLKEHDCMSYTTIVSASASDLPTMQYIAPYSATSIGEEWMENGKDVLIIYDDLTKHAIAYRTISLLLRRPPGREAFPGDVFYLHSRLLERSGRLDDNNGSGSMTALPIIETQASDISAYIPTNVISITDGQLFMQSNLFKSGQRPAIDIGLSVSRVGSAAQKKCVKQTSGSMKLDLAQFRELESFSSFGSDVDDETLKIINRGKKIMQILNQGLYQPLSQSEQSIILFTIKEKMIKWIPLEEIERFKNELLFYFNNSALSIKKNLDLTLDFSEELKEQFRKGIKVFINIFVKSIPNYSFSIYGDEAEIKINDQEMESFYKNHTYNNKITKSIIINKEDN